MDYTITRSNRKTLSVSVKDGKVTVRAPKNLTEEKISAFVTKHRLWISRRLEEQSRRFVPDFSDGATIEIAGIPRKIMTGKACLTAEILFLPAAGREKALVSLLKKFTRERMGRITGEIALKYGFRYDRITVTSARTRWGSCNTKGTIAYSFRSAFLPDGIALYLAVHELCHTRFMNHGNAFWELVQSMLPDWKERRKALKIYSWAMKCL